MAGVLCDVLHGQTHFMDGGGDHVGHFLLPTRAFGGVVHHSRHLAHGCTQALTGSQYFTDQGALTVQEAVETTRQVAKLIGAGGIQPVGQISTTATDGHQCFCYLPNRSHQPARQQYHQQQADQGYCQADAATDPQGAASFGVDLRLWHFGHQRPVEITQGQAERQVVFAPTGKAAVCGSFLTDDRLGCGRADLLG
ncbi:hypothetical protein D3C73_893460 [compost metagenome]